MPHYAFFLRLTRPGPPPRVSDQVSAGHVDTTVLSPSRRHGGSNIPQDLPFTSQASPPDSALHTFTSSGVSFAIDSAYISSSRRVPQKTTNDNERVLVDLTLGCKIYFLVLFNASSRLFVKVPPWTSSWGNDGRHVARYQGVAHGAFSTEKVKGGKGWRLRCWTGGWGVERGLAPPECLF